MRVIVVSLERAAARRARIARRLAEIDLPFEFMDAVDARELTEADLTRIDARYRRRWGLRPLAPAELACWLSHARALALIAAGPDPAAVILEDDAVPRPELPAVLGALEDGPAPFDVVSLARRRPERPLVAARSLAAGRSVGRVRYAEYGAYGYVVAREVARRLADHMCRMRLPLDMELMSFWVHGLDLHFLDEAVVDHDDGPSQIAAARARVLAGWRRPRLRQAAYRLQMAARKRIGFRRLVRGEIRAR